MSDSEGSKELSGIARSIDALFAEAPPDGDESFGVETRPEPPPDAEAPPLPDAEPTALDAFDADPLPLPDAPPPALDAVDAEPPPPLPDVPPPALEGFDGEPPPPLPDAEPPPLPDAEPPASDAFDADPPPPPDDAAVEARSDDADAAEPPPMPDRGAEGPGRLQETEGDGDETPEPTRLDLAVDAYLEGDTGKASDIRTIAEEMLERRELDPIARSVARLATAAGDPPDPSVLAVAEAISSPFVLARLAGLMGVEHDEGRREEYYLACRNLGEPMAVAVRDDLAESTDRHARRIHCEALVEMGDEGRTMIEQMALDENRFLVRNAVAILGETGGDRAVELVTLALANPDARVRREALRSLAKLGDEESGELVFGLLDDTDRDVRIAAAVTAGELHVERALRPMIKLLDDSNDPDESIPLIRALGHLGDPGAVPSIEKHAVRTLFSKPRTDVRIVAYRALHQIGTPHARRLLNQAVDDKEDEVKAAVKEMLGMS